MKEVESLEMSVESLTHGAMRMVSRVPAFLRLSTLIIQLSTLLLLVSCSSTKEERRSAVVPSNAAELGATRGLTDIRTFIPDVAVDLRYASRNNIAGRPLYPANAPCLLKTGTAMKLQRAQEILREKGFGLRVWDAWRPPEVQLFMVETTRDSGLFLNPKSAWSRHCSGTAVDVTLVDLKGREVEMPTYHDEGGEKARYNYSGGNRQVHRNLHTLQRAMVDAGFQLLDTEWWHFDDSDYMLTPAPVVFGHEIGIRVENENAP